MKRREGKIKQLITGGSGGDGGDNGGGSPALTDSYIVYFAPLEIHWHRLWMWSGKQKAKAPIKSSLLFSFFFFNFIVIIIIILFLLFFFLILFYHFI